MTSSEHAPDGHNEDCSLNADALRARLYETDHHAAMLAALREDPCYQATYTAWQHTELPGTQGSTYEQLLGHLPVTPEDRETALALWLHHEVTGAHSVRTASFVALVVSRSKMIRDMLARENLSHTDVIRAALVHDAGKLDIPSAVLSAKPNDHECMAILEGLWEERDPETMQLLARYDIAPGAPFETVRTTLDERHLRPVRAVPVRHLIAEEDLAALAARGIETEAVTLLDIIDTHEYHTRRRYKENDPTIAAIAGHHHTPHESRYPLAAQAVGVSSHIAAEVLHLVDIVEAITATRDYHTGRPLVEALVAEIHDARHKNINAVVLDETLRVFEETNGMQLAHECGLYPAACAELNDYAQAHNLPRITKTGFESGAQRLAA